MRPEALPIPDAALRRRVTGHPDDPAEFLAVGRRIARDLGRATASVGRPLESFRAVLDFGCGCGRATRFLPLGGELVGADIDPDAIAWCRANLPFAAFLVNGALPPLDVPASHFDLVAAISVFSHFDESEQRAWLAELERVTRPGGLVVASLMGDWSPLAPEHLARRDRDGFIHFEHEALRADLPYSHRATYHTRDYVLAEWARFFTIHDFWPRALNGDQDLVLMEKR